MKKLILLILIAGLVFCSCTKKESNPFYTEWDTPFGTPPFSKIENGHYLPAFEKGMEEQMLHITAIIENEEPATFENTIEAMEASSVLLDKVSGVFYNLNSAHTNDELQTVAEKIAPLRSKHDDDIAMNPGLFERVKTVYEQKDTLGLTSEQQTLLDKYYKEFVKGGANLNDEDKAVLRGINEELSLLTLKFGQNILKETNKFEMVIKDENNLAGLPDDVISAAAETAKEREKEGTWIFTIHKPSLIPFLTYSEKRDLREEMFRAYIDQGNHDDELDNKAIATKVASLRVKKANLLGYQTHAQLILEENMAKTAENVYSLLDQIWKPALERAKEEAAEFQDMIYADGNDFKLEPWDWWFYAEKVKKQKYALDDSILRPYFKLENVIEGVFTVSNKLWGLQFEERTDIPIYHEDVKVFEVKDADGSHVGILYADYFPRASKRGGAWMNNYREQSKLGGKEVRPIICNIGNFSKPTGDKPSLISTEEAATLFHEFGHALHGLLADTTYKKISGTNVSRDFVELPSQIMENWAFEPEVLKLYAKHYETGEVIPQELIDKMSRAKHFNQGFITVEYMAACYLDMDWHTLADPEEKDCFTFETESLDRIGLIPEIVVRYRSPYFRHIFSGGYSAGYYSYIWSEVLDSDAFQAFKETSLFDQATALSFRQNILEAGGTEDAMILYKRFRGREPNVEPLLQKRGLY